MSSERWPTVDRLFRRAVDLEEAEQGEFLERSCSNDPQLRGEVESLLAAHHQAGDFMENAVRAEAELLTDSRIGTRMGAYRIVRPLGRGGMGTVYLAMRADESYRKEVAIKVIKRGMDTEEIQRRFRRERQILASLDHPNIARLLDAATTDDGLPCFVMEYAPGLPIDQYCSQHLLSTSARLELFRTVCAAVQSAHQNLVVHRDLKPSNILVSRDGVPKLLDFGIAKLLDSEGAPQTMAPTAEPLKVMTPQFASPEQVHGEPITTASDVYSLGVLLYVLLTGQLPYRFSSKREPEMERVICDQEPQRPSLVGAAEARQQVARGKASPAHRDALRRARRRLAGDLDNIVLMALRKEPRRRYASVERLSEDVRRHLVGLPVAARRPTVGYRATKFMRRNRAAVLAGALSATLLLAGVTATLWQAKVAIDERARAEAERDRAEAVSLFMEELFQVSDPSAARGNTVTARELLDRGAERILDRLQDQPEAQAKLMDTIGRSYQGLGLYDPAHTLLDEALSTLRRALGEEHLAVAEIRDNLAGLLYDEGDYETAAVYSRQALETRRRLLGEAHPLVAESLNNVAENLRVQGENEAAEPLLRQALAMKRLLLGPEHLDVATSLNNLAAVLAGKGDLKAAEPLFQEALEMRRRLLDENDPAVVDSLSNLGFVLYHLNDYDRAEPLFRQVLSKRRELLGEEHPAVAQGINNLATVLSVQGDYDSAEPLLRQALEMKRRLLGANHPGLAVTLHSLGSVLHALGDFDGAEPHYREALQLRRRTLAENHPSIAESALGLGQLLLDRDEHGAAEPLLREALRIRRRALPAGDWRIAEAESAMAGLLVATGRYAQAEGPLVRAVEILEAELGAEDPRTRRSLYRLATLYKAAGRPAASATDQHPQADSP